MKFLCDEMLQRLGNWLRAAGYDTWIEKDGRSDYELLKQAITEGRLLITRDRKLMEHRRAEGVVVLLECEGLEDCIRALSEQLPIDWLHQPFIRCMVCNTLLRPAHPDELTTLPDNIQNQVETPLYCPTCRKVYWNGGHVKRMHKRLEKWQQAYGTESVRK